LAIFKIKSKKLLNETDFGTILEILKMPLGSSSKNQFDDDEFFEVFETKFRILSTTHLTRDTNIIHILK
jgi:hypothetical protein